MSTKFRNLKNDLQDLENDSSESGIGISPKTGGGGSKTANYILVIAFVVTLLFYAGSRVTNFFTDIGNPISEAIESFNEYDPELLAGMGEMMEDMGYGVLSDAELSALRDEGVTATETKRFHDLGYTDLTLEEVVELRNAGVSASETQEFFDVGYNNLTVDQLIDLENANVSATYASMMKELGYSFTVDDLTTTRRNGVTANFTSRMMDLGYTFEELTKENLIRMRNLDVTDNLAAQLIAERGERPTVDELIRYKISNQ
ncbi:MAG: hypothetical protein ED557_02880 [Balneola sp.]|nr:MAG: hypothetical protein ED557_02880 [Balneola sp.]